MELEEALLTIPINPNNFPAKLWRLVNSPKNRSIRWDPCGEGVIIDQQLFEVELLSPMKPSGETADLFKTTNFTSFIRQLNLYGFRKVVLGPGTAEKMGDGDLIVTDGVQHHFHNPNFKQDHPELLVNLRRLTSGNKAKMEAGIEVSCRPPNRFRRLLANSTDDDETSNVNVKVEKRGSMFVHRPTPYQYHHDGSQQMKEYDRTPIPNRGWIMGHGDASSPTTFYTDKGIPISVIHRFPPDSAVQSSPTTVHVQQGSQGIAATGQKYNSFIPHHTQYRPGFYSPVCQCCTPGSVDSDMTGCAHQTTQSYPHYSYYQPNYPVSFLHSGNQNQDWQGGDNQETKKNSISLDTVFQIVDELQASPKLRMVKVDTPEKHFQTSAPSVSHPAPALYSSAAPASTQPQLDSYDPGNSISMPIAMDANPGAPYRPVPVGGIIIAVPGNVTSGIAITVGAPSSLPEGESEIGAEQGPALSEPAAFEFCQKVLNGAEEVPECYEETSEGEASDTTDALNHINLSQESKSTRQQRKSPDLNLLVDVACKQDS